MIQDNLLEACDPGLAFNGRKNAGYLFTSFSCSLRMTNKFSPSDTTMVQVLVPFQLTFGMVDSQSGTCACSAGTPVQVHIGTNNRSRISYLSANLNTYLIRRILLLDMPYSKFLYIFST